MNEQQVNSKKNIFIIAIIILVILGVSIYWQRRGANKAEVDKELDEANLKEMSATPLDNPEGTMILGVYFGNEKLSGASAADCGKVFVTERKIPKITTVARAALMELFKGPTETEKKEGYFTAIAPGVEIKNLVIENGIAKADFSEALGVGVDSACESSIVRGQIAKTLKQFPTIKDVLISINGRTEGILQPVN